MDTDDSHSVLFEGFPELAYLCDAQGFMVNWNKHLEAVSQYNDWQIRQMHALDFFPAADHQAVRETIAAVFSSGYGYVEANLLTAAGDQIPYFFSGHRITYHNKPALLGVAVDISQRRTMENKLRENERFLATLLDNLPGIVYRCANDRLWSMHFITDACQSLTGYTAQEFLNNTPTLAELIHPDDAEMVWQAVQSAVNKNTRFELSYRLYHRELGYRQVWEQGRAIVDENNQILALEGFVTDITEQREAENQAQRFARRLTTTLESISDAFCTLDRDWRITYMNRQAEEVMGCSRSQAMDRDFWQAFLSFNNTSLEDELRGAMHDNQSISLEFYWPDAERWLQFNIYPSEEGLALYFRDITQHKQDRSEIEFLAQYDPLTQLPNRRLLDDRLEQEIAIIKRRKTHAAILFLDFDDFKTINDAYGHDTGDLLLQQLTARLTAKLRSNDTVARFGGDEFAVIIGYLPTEPDQATKIAMEKAEELRAALAEPYELNGHYHHGSVSIGITIFGPQDDNTDELLKRADLAMYQAKDAGRNAIRQYHPAMSQAISKRVRMENELRMALDSGSIEPYFQAQFDASNQLIGVEALARWHHPSWGIVPPMDFITVAEQTGLIHRLGDAMLKQTCQQIAIWNRQNDYSHIMGSVNVSARQFHHPGFVERVLQIAEETGVCNGQLHLELTESLFLSDLEDIKLKMIELNKAGIHFSLDDFGTGYSSLAYLKSLPLTRLKIDKRFVLGMAEDGNDAAIVDAIIAIANSLHIDVLAEGVETEETRALLAQYGCRQFQGYLYGYPKPASEFEQYLSHQPPK